MEIVVAPIIRSIPRLRLHCRYSLTCLCNRAETTHSDATQNNNAANISINKTALRIIIDLPFVLSNDELS
jgi:hypothetical protein